MKKILFGFLVIGVLVVIVSVLHYFPCLINLTTAAGTIGAVLIMVILWWWQATEDDRKDKEKRANEATDYLRQERKLMFK